MRNKVTRGLSFFSRNYNSSIDTAFDSEMSIETLIWLPARKKRNKHREIVDREILSPTEAKSLYSSEDKNTIDPWGHVATKIQIKNSGSDNARKVNASIQQVLADRYNLRPSMSHPAIVNSLDAYVSWYPGAANSGNHFTDEELSEWYQRVNTGISEVDAGKSESINLFKQEYKARNGSYQRDVKNYGEPDFVYTMSIGIDFTSLVRACFDLLRPQLNGTTVTMNQAHDHATYFGKAMLEEVRFASRLLGTSATLPELLPDENAMQVCTTANLHLLKAGLGDDLYTSILKQTLSEESELGKGFPITHFVSRLVKNIAEHPDLVSVQNDENESGLSFKQ